MKKNTVKRIVVTVALVVVGITAPSASAACNPPKFASTYNPATGASVYWTTSITNPNASLEGKIWSGNTDYTGSCNDGAQTFFYFAVFPGTFGMSLSLGNACVPPGLCPSGNLNARAWVTDPFGAAQDTGARQVPETPSGGLNFDFSDSVVNLQPSPRPRVQSKGRVGGTLNVQTFPAPIPGDAASLATVTGCNIRLALSPSYPGNHAVLYPTLVTTVPASGGQCATTNVAIDCTAVSPDRWLVYQLVTTAGPDATVGPPLRVNCNPALADPKNKITPKKNTVGVRS